LRVKLDENLPAGALAVALELGHVDNVSSENLTGATDPDVLAAATADGRLLITLDRRFGDIRAHPLGTHGGIGVLRVNSHDAATVTEAARLCLSREELRRAGRVHRRGKGKPAPGAAARVMAADPIADDDRAAHVSEVVGELIVTGVLGVRDIAQVTGISPRTVSRWLAAEGVPRRGAWDRLIGLKTVVDALRRVLRDEPARLWLRSPNAALDWRKPAELIADGDYRRVIGAVLVLAEGVTA
jgi:predicted nuclease of predicted toxin-antitoxin system/alkylated DNA nucleotide flippase Atl1